MTFAIVSFVLQFIFKEVYIFYNTVQFMWNIRLLQIVFIERSLINDLILILFPVKVVKKADSLLLNPGLWFGILSAPFVVSTHL